jgi:hypothetical protein
VAWLVVFLYESLTSHHPTHPNQWSTFASFLPFESLSHSRALLVAINHKVRFTSVVTEQIRHTVLLIVDVAEPTQGLTTEQSCCTFGLFCVQGYTIENITSIEDASWLSKASQCATRSAAGSFAARYSTQSSDAFLRLM